ncbi:MAG: hypothetical protein ABIF77_13950, partial [bacterium]
MFRSGRRSIAALAHVCLLLVALSTAPVLGSGYVPDPTTPRSEVPEPYQWQTDHIFASVEEWAAELAAFTQDIARFSEYEGRLGESADVLYELREFADAMNLRVMKLFMHANLNFDVDQSNSENEARLGQIRAIFPQYGAAVAFMEPELLALDEDLVWSFINGHEGLQEYKFAYEELLRGKDHTLSQPEEELMALTGNIRGVPSRVHGSLMNVDLDFGELIDENGETVPLTINAWSKYRSGATYNVRKQATDKFFGTLRQFENTFANLLDGVVKSHLMSVQARGYESCMEASVYPEHISPTAYHML